MKILIDTDVLIDVALNRKRFVEHSVWVLDAAQYSEIQAFIAWHSLANFYYIVSSPSGSQKAQGFIKDLLEFVEVAPVKTEDALYALSLKIADFEDSLQIAAAQACRAEKIITRNIKHYRNSPIQAVTPEQFRNM